MRSHARGPASSHQVHFSVIYGQRLKVPDHMAAWPQQKLASCRTRALQRFRISCPHALLLVRLIRRSPPLTAPPHASPPDRHDSGIPRKKQHVCGEINLSRGHLRGVVARCVMGNFFERGAPAAPALEMEA